MNTFNRLVRNSADSSNREVIGLAVYYMHIYGEADQVTVSEIHNLFDINGIPTSSTAIAAYITELVDDDLVTTQDSSDPTRYRLTQEGFRAFGGLAGQWDTSRPSENPFIDTSVDDNDYQLLLDHINHCFAVNINDAVLVLTRKLFENLLIDILRSEFGGQQLDLYYNKNIGQFHGLGTLCNNLRDNLGELAHYSRELDGDLVDQIETFREEGNSQAHSIRIGVSNDELESMKSTATKLTETLWIIREEVRIAND